MAPKYVLYFYDRTPGQPFAIKENCYMDGKLMCKFVSGHFTIEDALESLGRLSAKPIVVAFTEETVS